MIQKVYTVENLDCANCAAKIEAKINALPEVEAATITFATKQLRITADDPDALIEKLTAIARTVEHEVTIISAQKQNHSHRKDPACGHEHKGCACGHGHHHEHESCACGHDHHHSHGDSDLKTILTGGVFFALGLVLNFAHLQLFSLCAFVVAYIILGREIMENAWKNLRNGHMLDENFLMSIASIGALFIGEAAEAVGVVLFYRVGEYFEEQAVSRSRSQIMEAVDLRPETVILESGAVIPAEDAKAGDILIVRPGDRIPLDGIVLRGESRIDTAPITGEPVPVRVASGDSVTSGCVNTSGQLTVRVVHPLSESMVTRILNSVENAAASKPKIDRFITRFARVYTPIVVALATAVAIIPPLFTGDWRYWVYTALSFLVMSCPCALVLSVPLAFFAGIGTGSKKGILFKGGASIEALSNIRAVAMDKTGTLTRGDFRVQQINGDVLHLSASCEAFSTHPIGISIMQEAKKREIALLQPEKIEEIAGFGIRAVIGGSEVLCGSRKLMQQHRIALPAGLSCAGTHVIIAVNGKYEGDLLIADTLKPEAAAAVSRLKNQGLATAMLTGDSKETAEAIAKETGIDSYHAQLLPEDKLTALQQIRAQRGAVLYVGDGINDAPVLAGADVGAAMGSGADAAIEAADVVFMTSRVDAIAEAVSIARATKSIALQNVIFALAVKAVVMLLGLAGFADLWMAVFADSGVAMLCVLNSIRLLYQKK